MSSQPPNIDTSLRELLEDMIVNGDELGWVEYTDGGVWVTDKALAAVKEVLK